MIIRSSRRLHWWGTVRVNDRSWPTRKAPTGVRWPGRVSETRVPMMPGTDRKTSAERQLPPPNRPGAARAADRSDRSTPHWLRSLSVAISAAVWMIGSSGCQHHLAYLQQGDVGPPAEFGTLNAPRELHKAILPEYTIEPPDVLSIVGIHIVPQASYRLRTTDEVVINVLGTLPDDPIEGMFPIQPGGMVTLGAGYGRVKVAGQTAEEAQETIRNHLFQFLKDPQVTVSLAQTASAEQIVGEHLVAPDGRVTLGTYGSVSIVGLTKAQAKEAIEDHLTEFLDDPEVAVDVFGYNSKVYYVITQGGGLGDKVFSFPSTGNETILDAIAQINGLNEVSSKRIWVARPGPGSDGCDQVLPVDWLAVTKRGDVSTNYQVLPGDRVYVAEDRMVAIDNHLAKLFAPFERIMGFTLLGTQTLTRLSGQVLKGGGNPRGIGGGGGGF